MSEDYGLGMILGVAIGSMIRMGQSPEDVRQQVEAALLASRLPPTKAFTDALETEVRQRIAEVTSP